MKTNQKTMAKDGKQCITSGSGKLQETQGAQGTTICIQRGNTRKDQAKG